jgi:hypothetical protein
MLQYGGYTWLLDVRDSPIQARIGPGCRTADEVHWQVTLHYIAAGREWRRVKSWLRPTLRLCVYDFRPTGGQWQHLEGQAFNSDEENSGTLFIETTNACAPRTELNCGAYRLQFVRRSGFWFTTELVALPHKREPSLAASSSLNVHSFPFTVPANDAEPNLLSDDEPQGGDSIYVVEDIPFGLVEVAAPCNARCPQQYASARARALLGLTSPSDFDIGSTFAPDPNDGKQSRPVAGADWRVRLHHGERWTHFRL